VAKTESSDNETSTKVNTKSSSVKEKIMLFTKNKRSSFQSKRSQSQYVVENLDHAVISRKPSYTKLMNPATPIHKICHSIANQQPSQLILPDLTQTNGEQNKTPIKPKQRTPKQSLKETNSIETQPAAVIEFKSVKDRVQYFSSRLSNKIESTSGTLKNQIITPVITTTATTTTITTTTTSTTSTIMATSTPKIMGNLKSQAKQLQNTIIKNQKPADSICLLSPLKSATNSSSNLKLSSVSTASLTNNKSSKNNIVNKNATKNEVKNILIDNNSNENKITNLIEKFTKRK
jgi:hypothetical protein